MALTYIDTRGRDNPHVYKKCAYSNFYAFFIKLEYHSTYNVAITL